MAIKRGHTDVVQTLQKFRAPKKRLSFHSLTNLLHKPKVVLSDRELSPSITIKRRRNSEDSESSRNSAHSVSLPGSGEHESRKSNLSPGVSLRRLAQVQPGQHRRSKSAQLKRFSPATTILRKRLAEVILRTVES